MTTTITGTDHMSRDRESSLPFVNRHDECPIKVGDDTHIFHVIPVQHDLLVLSVTTYNGKRALDIRRYYLDTDHITERGTMGTWKPTSKGVRIANGAATRALLDALVYHDAAIRATLEL